MKWDLSSSIIPGKHELHYPGKAKSTEFNLLHDHSHHPVPGNEWTQEIRGSLR
jgi:hypothetical protein